MIRDLDTVSLKKELVKVRDSQGKMINLPAGSIGTVVMIYDERVGCKSRPAYEVDFCDSTGDTIALLTLAPKDIKLDRSFKTMKKSGKFRHKKRSS